MFPNSIPPRPVCVCHFQLSPPEHHPNLVIVSASSVFPSIPLQPTPPFQLLFSNRNAAHPLRQPDPLQIASRQLLGRRQDVSDTGDRLVHHWVSCDSVFPSQAIRFSQFNMLFNFYILIRAHQFHVNFSCILAVLFLIHFVDNIAVIILKVSMVLEVVDGR